MMAWTGREGLNTTCKLCFITVDAPVFDQKTGLCDICFERDNRGKFRAVNPPAPVVLIEKQQRFARLSAWFTRHPVAQDVTALALLIALLIGCVYLIGNTTAFRR